MLKNRIKPTKLLLIFWLFLTCVSAQAAITVSVKTNPDPVLPGETIYTAITVGNTGSSASGSLTIQLRYPEHLNDLPHEFISNGGECNGSSNRSDCDPREFLIWTLGNLATGASTTVTLPPTVNSRTIDGTLITFNAEVFEDGGNVAIASRSVVVQSASVFDIAVDEDLNPVAPNQSLTYAITYANRSTASTTNTQLSFPLPADVSFVSASGGGTLNGSVVEWDLQTFPAKKGGRQTVTVNVNPAVTLGTLLEVDAATITGQTNSINHSARALATTRVGNNSLLALTVEFNPDPVQPNETLQGALTVGNISGAALFGVTLQLRYPELNDLPHEFISDGGECNGSSNRSDCDPREFLIWILGNLAPSASTTVTLPPIVNSRTPNGTLITFDAIVKEDNGRRARNSTTTLVSEFDFVSPPSVAPPPVTSPPVTPPSILISDVDGNGQSDALTDGLLIIRFLFGLSGSALTEGAIGAGSSMNSTQIIAFLTANSAAMDVDGNGSSDALTDGLLIIRYLFGIRGSALISGAIGPGATRSTIIDIENFLQDF